MKDYSDRIIDESADWYIRLQDNEVSTADREAFADWICASPQHVREYLALTSLHVDVEQLPTGRNVDGLIDLARKGSAENVIELGPLSPQEDGFIEASQSASSPKSKIPTGVRHLRRGPKLALLAAALVGVLLVSPWWAIFNPDTATYATSVGEQKSFPLPDGSLVTLNAVSKLKLHYTKRYRDVRLLSGEALFTVAKNRVRPFRVLTNDSVIQAVGTQFNVYHRRADTMVTVVEGTVEVRAAAVGASGPGQPALSNDDSRPPGAGSAGQIAPATSDRHVDGSPGIIRLTKGQRAHVESPDLPVSVSTADPAVDTAWRERRLIFESRPLGEVVAEFNLYNTIPFEIGDPWLASVQVSGSFNANDPESFAQFLDQAGIARSTATSGRILLRASAGR